MPSLRNNLYFQREQEAAKAAQAAAVQAAIAAERTATQAAIAAAVQDTIAAERAAAQAIQAAAVQDAIAAERTATQAAIAAERTATQAAIAAAVKAAMVAERAAEQAAKDAAEQAAIAQAAQEAAVKVSDKIEIYNEIEKCVYKVVQDASMDATTFLEQLIDSHVLADQKAVNIIAHFLSRSGKTTLQEFAYYLESSMDDADIMGKYVPAFGNEYCISHPEECFY